MKRLLVAIIIVTIILTTVPTVMASSGTLYETKKSGVPIWSEASSYSKQIRKLDKGKLVTIVSTRKNRAGSLWGKTVNNSWIYMGNLKRSSKALPAKGDYVTSKGDVPLRHIPAAGGKVQKYLPKDTKVKIVSTFYTDTGVPWGSTSDKYVVYMGNLIAVSKQDSIDILAPLTDKECTEIFMQLIKGKVKEQLFPTEKLNLSSGVKISAGIALDRVINSPWFNKQSVSKKTALIYLRIAYKSWDDCDEIWFLAKTSTPTVKGIIVASATLKNTFVECKKLVYGNKEVKEIADTYLGIYENYMNLIEDIRLTVIRQGTQHALTGKLLTKKDISKFEQLRVEYYNNCRKALDGYLDSPASWFHLSSRNMIKNLKLELENARKNDLKVSLYELYKDARNAIEASN
jgi:hypothetical protein